MVSPHLLRPPLFSLSNCAETRAASERTPAFPYPSPSLSLSRAQTRECPRSTARLKRDSTRRPRFYPGSCVSSTTFASHRCVAITEPCVSSVSLPQEVARKRRERYKGKFNLIYFSLDSTELSFMRICTFTVAKGSKIFLILTECFLHVLYLSYILISYILTLRIFLFVTPYCSRIPCNYASCNNKIASEHSGTPCAI